LSQLGQAEAVLKPLQTLARDWMVGNPDAGTGRLGY